jgi:hypothetical protein
LVQPTINEVKRVVRATKICPFWFFNPRQEI